MLLWINPDYMVKFIALSSFCACQQQQNKQNFAPPQVWCVLARTLFGTPCAIVDHAGDYRHHHVKMVWRDHHEHLLSQPRAPWRAQAQGAAMNTQLDARRPYTSLQESLPALLACLRAVLPMRLWMVGRLVGNSWTVVQADDRDERVKPGDSFPWPETLCARVLEHYGGACFAEDAADNPVLANVPVRDALQIGAYIGYPLLSWRGELLGTVCAVDPERQAPFTPQQKFIVETICRTISTLVAHSFKLDDIRRSEHRIKPPADIDHLTGLPNADGWRTMLEEEESLLRQEGEDALVAVLEIAEPDRASGADVAADWENNLIHQAQLLKSHVRERDAVARIDGNRFGLMLRGLSEEQGRGAAEKIRQTLLQDGDARIALGYAMRLSSGSLAEAARIADIRMYTDKLKDKLRDKASSASTPQSDAAGH
jgi:GGDEF domain-containing protein